MPSRPLFLLILTCWVCTGVWFFDRDLWPRIRPDTAPLYTIELADEAVRQSLSERWVATRNGHLVGDINTSVRYSDADDTFELMATGKGLDLIAHGPLRVTIKDLNDRVRINRDRELSHAAFEAVIEVRVLGIGSGLTGTVTIAGDARKDKLERRCQVKLESDNPVDTALEPVPLTHGVLLNPLQPVPRIADIRHDGHWRQPLTDPVSDAVRELLERLPGGGQLGSLVPPVPSMLYAEVRRAAETIAWNGSDHECYVVDYRNLEGGDYSAVTWVRKSDGMVLRQETKNHGDILILQRQ